MTNWNAIESFIGYGDRQAPIVFVGMEEGFDPTGELEAELQLRSAYASIMDLYDAHATAGDDFVKAPGNRPTWIAMSYISLRYKKQTSPTYAECKDYMVHCLGRHGKETLLAELLPYPNTNTQEWRYAEKFPDRNAYLNALLPRRTKLLRDTISEGSRRLIVCYGKQYWEYYRAIFGDEAVWHKELHAEVSSWREARVVLTSHFAWKGFNGDSGLQRLASIVLGNAGG